MKVAWTAEAISELRSQTDYIARDDPRAALGQEEAVMDAARRLGTFPESGRVGREAGTRELVVPRTPFIVIYQVEDERVLILRLMHGAQLWPPGA